MAPSALPQAQGCSSHCASSPVPLCTGQSRALGPSLAAAVGRGHELKRLSWEEGYRGCSEGSARESDPNLGAGLASGPAALHAGLCWQGLCRVDACCGCLCPWSEGGQLPLILLGMWATRLWPRCLRASGSGREPLRS